MNMDHPAGPDKNDSLHVCCVSRSVYVGPISCMDCIGGHGTCHCRELFLELYISSYLLFFRKYISVFIASTKLLKNQS